MLQYACHVYNNVTIPYTWIHYDPPNVSNMASLVNGKCVLSPHSGTPSDKVCSVLLKRATFF